MTFDKTQLTAYALGELTGAAAREAEELLRKDESARRFVDEVRALATFAERDLRAEPLPSGRGAAPVLAGIARHEAARPSQRRVWLQAAALAALIALFTLAVPLRKHFAGNVAGVGRLDTNSANDGADPEIRPTHPPTKTDPLAAARDLAELEARPRSGFGGNACTASVPQPTAADRVTPGSGTDYVLAATGLTVTVSLSARELPLVHEEGVVEVARAEGATLFRHVASPQSIFFFVVPDGRVSGPFCELQVSVGTPPPEGGEQDFAAALESLAHSIAGKIHVSKR